MISEAVGSNPPSPTTMNITRGALKGMGRSVKRAVNSWLNNKLNEYHATRYKGKLVEVIKTARPIAAERIQPFMDYIINDNENAFARASALKRVVTALYSGQLDEELLLKIREYNLQLEELKHAFGSLSQEQKKVIIEFMLPGLKYNALVSNLVTIERVFATETRKVRKVNDHGAFD
jgi:60 kDa SS-A/Ro ribonucleoprotein